VAEAEQLLVIGYGSTLHSDDAAGQRVAEAVAGWKLPRVRAIAATQLTPEMASEIAQADRVIFVDAALKPIKPRKPQRCFGLVRLHPAGDHDPFLLGQHFGDPRALLALAKTLYWACPRARLITIPGVNFNLGEALSPQTHRGIEQALAYIRSLVDAFMASDRTP
jgi:hydrogenase maturation protease